jgi:hypothetical protein
MLPVWYRTGVWWQMLDPTEVIAIALRKRPLHHSSKPIRRVPLSLVTLHNGLLATCGADIYGH